MNNTNPQHDDELAPDELAPLDAFEQQWVDQLAQRDADLVQSEDAFVSAVMQKAQLASAASSIGHPPAVIARLGTTRLPYAVAAALLLAAFVGGYWLTKDMGINPGDNPIAKQNDNQTQPNNQPAVAPNNRPEVALGSLIANIKTTATGPANSLTTTVGNAPKTLSIDRLFNLLDGSVPDLKEILKPLEPKNEQSRA